MPRVVLAGAGHAHLGAIAAARELVRRDCELTVVAPGDFHYTGTATGELGGEYEPGFGRIDVAHLAASRGAKFVRARIAGVAAGARTVVLEDSTRIAYDVLSLDLGSTLPSDRPPGFAEHAHAVKPIERLVEVRRAIEVRGSGAFLRAVVVGGGPSACEVAANVERRCREVGVIASIAIVCAEPRLLADFGERASRLLAQSFARRGIEVRTSARAVAARAGVLELEDGSPLPFELLIDAGGSAPNPLCRELGLECDRDGALVVDEFLRTSDARIFAAGDCAELPGAPRKRSGVRAVRQGRVLLANLVATLDGGALRRWRPRPRELQILDLGDGSGIALFGKLCVLGPRPLALKRWIDRRWLDSAGASRTAPR